MPGRRGTDLHKSIKLALGYDENESSENVLHDWKDRLRRVCKPCWELHYCPYGPLVEKSPILPTRRSDKLEHNNYLKECLDSGLVGSVVPVTKELKETYQKWVKDTDLLLRQALAEIQSEKRFARTENFDDPDEQIEAWLGNGDLPPPHIYRVKFREDQQPLQRSDFNEDVWIELNKRAERKKKEYRDAIKLGCHDQRHPLEPARKAFFERALSHSVDELPEKIPEIFEEGSCTVYGHICPVFFAAESMTETEEERVIGRRQLSFKTMMRIVRRDDYRCQHCNKKLLDTEVEFDHIIPVSKGGRTEEHNLRLTCFKCNRGKSDDYIP